MVLVSVTMVSFEEFQTAFRTWVFCPSFVFYEGTTPFSPKPVSHITSITSSRPSRPQHGGQFHPTLSSLLGDHLPLSPALLWTCGPFSLFTDFLASCLSFLFFLYVSWIFIKGKSHQIILLLQMFKIVTLYCGPYLPVQRIPTHIPTSPNSACFLGAATRKDF